MSRIRRELAQGLLFPPAELARPPQAQPELFPP